MSTLHCALKNGADLYVKEHQKIQHYHARSTEERRRKKDDKSYFTSRGAYVKLRCYTLIRLEISHRTR